MSEFSQIMSAVLNPQLLVTVFVLILGVLLAGYITARNKKNRRKKPGQYIVYEVPGRTAAECRDILSRKNIYDTFAYTLEPAPSGGYFVTFTRHIPTEQGLATVFQLQFEAENPAKLSLLFVREVFGMKEPVLPEALLDEFFAQKLGAVRAQPLSA